MAKDYEPTPEDTKYAAEGLYTELVETHGKGRNCISCGKNSVTSFGGDGLGRHAHHEYDNILPLELHGGYGLFFDNIESGNYTVILCHECAHEACDKLPWLSKLLVPHNSYSHTLDFHEANPDHYGWDYDHKKEN